MKRTTWFVLAVIVIGIVCIVYFYSKNCATDESELKTNINSKDIVYQDAYIFSCSNEKISFICDGEKIEYKGKPENEFTGVANIEIEDGKIKSIKSKPDIINGTLASFTNQNITFSSGESNELLNDQIPIYDVSGEEISEIDFGQLVLGGENIDLVMENGKVCAVLRKSNPDLSFVRVLLKQGDETVWPQVTLLSNEKLVINGHSDLGKSLDVGQYFTDNNISSMEISSSDNYILFNGKKYEGDFIVTRFDNGFSVVNKIQLEEYVKYVLPSEMPIGFTKEALKAQAVCARTFACSQMKNATYAMYGANLDDSTSYQVYNASGRFDVTDAAVDETQGEVITCNGQLITCYYFSTSGGKTEDMEVWGSDTPAFIKKVESIDDNSAYFKWCATLDVTKYTDSEYGRAKGITVNSISESGYVLSLTVEYENGTLVFTKENDIRKELGKYLTRTQLNDGTSRDNLTMIPSACFTLEKISDNEYKLQGSGFGHGIGMSQYGADKLGSSGYTYEDIICYYYNDVKVVKRN